MMETLTRLWRKAPQPAVLQLARSRDSDWAASALPQARRRLCREIRRKVPIILGLVDLEDKAQCKPAELSGGEQQRVGLARALINNPKLIIADEPTGNVDPALSFEIVDLLSEINRHGTTVLMVTHEHSLVKHFHRRIVEIHNGRIVADSGKEAMIR